MPKILKRLVKQLKDKGYSESAAYAIATSQLQKAGNLKKGTNKATKKGKKRGNMSPAARAKDREVKYRGGSPDDYAYNPKTNRVRKRKR